MARRSVLISPGDQPRKLAGALELAADVVVFDLEDGVAPDDKPAARETVVDVLRDAGSVDDREVLVRVNPPDAGGDADVDALAALAGAGLPHGFVLPKVEAPAAVHDQRDRLRAEGLGGGLWCLIEAPAGVLAAVDIAAVRGVTALVFGGEDYATAVGGERTAAGTELLYARQHLVAAATAAGVDAIDGITTALEDVERVGADAREAKTFGFDGKLAVHPAQLEPINTAFTPTAAQVDWARRVVAAAEETGDGAFRVDGEMVDAPLIERARAILEAADAG